jgi:predicted transcriptional regulator
MIVHIREDSSTARTSETVNIFIELTVRIVSAYVRNNAVSVAELPALIRSVHNALCSPFPAEQPKRPKKHKQRRTGENQSAS